MFFKGERCIFRNDKTGINALVQVINYFQNRKLVRIEVIDTYHDSKHGLFGTVQAAESSLIVPEHFLEHLPTPTACISSKEVSE